MLVGAREWAAAPEHPRNPAVHHYRLAAGHLVEMLTV
jgi:hypothetical protein